MRLENGFTISATQEQVWLLLNDVPRVIPCMPGAELREVTGDNAWKAALNVKLGPVALQFETDVHRDRVDEATKTITLSAKARDVKGRGTVMATMESSLSAAAELTRVSIVTDLTLQGSIAQYGRGVVPEIAGELTKQFAECLATALEPIAESIPNGAARVADGARPIAGLSLGIRAAWHTLLRRFRRGSAGP